MTKISPQVKSDTFRDIIRKAVIATNPVWPFSKLNRVPYYIAIKYFVRMCGNFPQIKSVYLRHSLVEGNWIPGASDIDLTIIINSGQNAQEEFNFLGSFWRSFLRLQKFFPMICDVDILDDQFIKVWTKFGFRGQESKYWKLLYGAAIIEPDYSAQPQQRARDAFNYAIKYYRSFFKEIFSRPDPDLIRLHRFSRKILKYIHYGHNNHELKEKIADCNKEQLLCHLMMSLNEEAVSFNGFIKSKGGLEEAGCKAERYGPILAGLDLEAIECVLYVNSFLLKLSKKRNYVIVLKDDGLDFEKMENCVAIILKKLNRRTKPFILTYPVLCYMLRIEDPCRYYEIINHTQVIYGKDLVRCVQPPDENSLMAAAVNQSMNVFVYPRKRRVIFPPEGDRFSNSLYFNEVLRETLCTRLYLETRELIWDLKGLLTKYEQFLPHYYERIARLRNNKSNYECYLLLRDLANDVHERVSRIRGMHAT